MILQFKNLRRFSTKFGDISKQQSSSDNLPEYLRYGESPGENFETETQSEQIMGLEEFKQGVKYELEKDYDESEHFFKESLKILKKQNQDKSMGYLYILKRLAYVSYLNKKYSDSEKYFTVVSNMMPQVTKNTLNTFQSQCNLLVLYTNTNLEKAVQYGQMIEKDSQEQSQLYQKQYKFMMANIFLMTGQFEKAKEMYRKCLKSHANEDNAKILNNLAYASWQHVKKDNSSSVVKDSEYIMSWLKESVQQQEQLELQRIDLDNMALLQELTTSPKQDPELYLPCLTSPQLGISLTNLSEYSLVSGSEESSFWFRLGLKYYEKVIPQDMERHLVLLGLFYASKGQFKQAEGLYAQVIDKLQKENSRCYTLVMAKSLYGKMLMATGRQKEAVIHLKHSESLVRQLPYWWDDLDHLYTHKFEIK